MDEFDLIIVGGGPAGLSAAINGASEGLRVRLIDSGPSLGGQARASSLIENYSGFPEGIPGSDLLGRFVRQAQKFKADIQCPLTAAVLRREDGHIIVVSDDEQSYAAKSVILSIGLSYRRHGAKNIGPLMGQGILYGSPAVDPESLGECTICIVGGANSAGQAAMHLAKNKRSKIKILVRKNLDIQMSQYLIDRIIAAENIEVIEGTEVVEAFGATKLERIAVKHPDGVLREMNTDHMFIFIGAQPKTMWLNGSIEMDPKRFILTGPKLLRPDGGWQEKRQPLPFETSMPGVFACGDVRVGSTKRVGAAVGEGTTALAMCHEYFALMNGGH